MWNRMSAALLTDRINATEAAALAPIPPPSTAQTPAQQPQANDQSAGATLVGVTAPPVPPGQPSKARTTSASASPGPAPATNQLATAASGGAISSQTLPPVTMPPPGQALPTSAETAQRVANGHLPAIPTQEPPRPDIAPGPPAPLAAVTAIPPSVAPPADPGNEIDFVRGSAALTDVALAEVKAMAAERDGRPIAVTGYGDAATSDAIGQSNALNLGFSRAQALATALVAQGVPYARLRLNAEAAGRGASLRLLQ